MNNLCLAKEAYVSQKKIGSGAMSVGKPGGHPLLGSDVQLLASGLCKGGRDRSLIMLIIFILRCDSHSRYW
jgi:hypothetical protein